MVDQLIYIYIYIHGAFNKFPDFFVQAFKIVVIAIHLMRWLTNFYDFSFKWTATAAFGIHPTKAWLSQLENFKNAIWTLEEGYAIKFCFKLGKKCHAMKAGSTAMTQRPRDWVPSGIMLALSDLRKPDRANLPRNFWWSLFWQHWHDPHVLGSHWTDSQQGILCWGFKGVQQEIPSEEASTLQIGSVAFPPGQYTSPQLHPCHRLFDQDGHQDSSSPSL